MTSCDIPYRTGKMLSNTVFISPTVLVARSRESPVKRSRTESDAEESNRRVAVVITRAVLVDGSRNPPVKRNRAKSDEPSKKDWNDDFHVFGMVNMPINGEDRPYCTVCLKKRPLANESLGDFHLRAHAWTPTSEKDKAKGVLDYDYVRRVVAAYQARDTAKKSSEAKS